MTGKYRHSLPQMNGKTMLTDGGTETYLIYKEGLELPHFSTFHRLADKHGYDLIKAYFQRHADIAAENGLGFIFCSLTYRSSRDWGELLGYTRKSLEAINIKAINLFREISEGIDSPDTPMVLSGCIGPRGDAYKLGTKMTAAQAQSYHAEQISTFDKAGIDMITGLTLSETDEAVGMTRAAQEHDIPCVISFTVGKGGILKTGQTLREAIDEVDTRTHKGPAYYMINCAHPDDFSAGLEDADWMKRIQGIRANASNLDHGILCQLGHLEEGEPVELGRQHSELAQRFPHLNVWGGCCGTDHVHVAEICKQVMRVAPQVTVA